MTAVAGAQSNGDIAERFERLADLLEIDGANPFRVRAYRNAAEYVARNGRSFAELVAQGVDLTTLPNIGKEMAAKIVTIVRTGELPALKQIEERVPPIMADLLEVSGMGPKRVRLVHDKLAIGTRRELEQALDDGSLRALPGFGAAIEQKIREALARKDGG